LIRDPVEYEAWYHTPRGAWIGNTEFSLVQSLLRPAAGTSLLDVGCGTGWFSRRFAEHDLQVTGIDPDPAAIACARSLGGEVSWMEASATALPFADNRFDYSVAVTSLCFISDVEQAGRVSTNGMVLGLLNRHSLLYRQKHGRGGYTGARWDTAAEVRAWATRLHPVPHLKFAYAVFLPGGSVLARVVESRVPPNIPLGGFCAVVCTRSAVA